MIRRWIPLKDVNPFDNMHSANGESFSVDEQADGQSLEQHLKGIEYIKGVIIGGQKVRPILVRDDEDGSYQRLDGFKRYWAHKELGEQFIEAFVCTVDEYRRAVEYDYGNGKIRAWHGGLPKEDFGLFEGAASEQFNYESLVFLFKSANPAGLRIELDECIHVHWGEYGKQRLTLGRKDFEALAEVISQI